MNPPRRAGEARVEAAAGGARLGAGAGRRPGSAGGSAAGSAPARLAGGQAASAATAAGSGRPGPRRPVGLDGASGRLEAGRLAPRPSSGDVGLGAPVVAVVVRAPPEHRADLAGDRDAPSRACPVGDGLRLVEAEADHPADRVVADRHAVERVGGLDRAAVVGDDDELGLVGEAPEGRPRTARRSPRRARRRPRRGRRTGPAGPRASRTAARPPSAPARRPTASPAPAPSCRAAGRRSRPRSRTGRSGRSGQPGEAAAEQLLEPRVERASRAAGTSSRNWSATIVESSSMSCAGIARWPRAGRAPGSPSSRAVRAPRRTRRPRTGSPRRARG